MINIVIPMAGEGSRFAKAGFTKPKPFIDVVGLPMIERVIQNLDYPDARFILIGRKKHLDMEVKLVEQIKKKWNVLFIPIDHVTEGTACTVLFARDEINNEDPLIIANSDQLIDIDISSFIEDCFVRRLDGSILTFIDTSMNPKWSFARINQIGIVEEVSEKVPISERATVGIYLFKHGRDFINAAIDMIIRNDRVNNEFYTCPVYNQLIRSSRQIGVYDIPQKAMHGLGTPEDLKLYLNG